MRDKLIKLETGGKLNYDVIRDFNFASFIKIGILEGGGGRNTKFSV